MSPESVRVLVIDDNESIHRDLRKVLAQPDDRLGMDELEQALFGESRAAAAPAVRFVVDAALSGREGHEKMRAATAAGAPYAIAFVDMRMPPGMDGLETMMKLWAEDPELQVILCTAFSDHSWSDIIERVGVTDRLLILRKPFHADEARQMALAMSTKRSSARAARLKRSELERVVQERTRQLEHHNQRLTTEIAQHQATFRALQASNETCAEQARVLAMLLELSNRLARCRAEDDAIAHVLELLAAISHCRRISIMLPDYEHRVLRIAGAVGIPEHVKRGVAVPFGGRIAGAVFVNGSSLVINTADDAEQAAPLFDQACFASLPLVSRALVTSEHVVGVLNITDRDGGAPFSASDQETIGVVGNMAASAIHEIQTRRARDAARDSIVTVLATLVEYRDGDTGRHLERVTEFALLLAEAMRDGAVDGGAIDADFLADLRNAVPLHDIGKVAVPDAVLSKPTRLTPQEMEQMKRHAMIGAHAIASMMARSAGVRFLAMARDIALHHHEHYNGGGYPHGLSGVDIPLAARIASLADVYDALTTVRPYKPAFSHEKAVEIILEGRGTQFDPLVVDAFLQQHERFARLAEELADAPEVGVGAEDAALAGAS